MDWIGTKNQIDAVAATDPTTHVVLVSRMGGTDPHNPINEIGRVTLPDGQTKAAVVNNIKTTLRQYIANAMIVTFCYPFVAYRYVESKCFYNAAEHLQGGDLLLWKRKAERYLVSSGLPFTIIHPGKANA